ncbi:MAG: GntR family transcriptional regulator [Pseudoxanthomonas sp.]
MDTRTLHIAPSSPEPIYRQIAEQLKRMAAGGQLRPGELLPSVREVAAVHAINPMTVSRAYSQLEAEGVLERLRGKGMAVAARPANAGRVGERLRAIEPRLDELARHCRELELPPSRVIERLRHLLGDTDE